MQFLLKKMQIRHSKHITQKRMEKIFFYKNNSSKPLKETSAREENVGRATYKRKLRRRRKKKQNRQRELNSSVGEAVATSVAAIE